MRDFLRHLARNTGLLAPSLVGGSVLLLTALSFFRVALLPEFGAELEMSAVELGAVATVFAVGRLAADLPGGHLADRVGALRLLGGSALAVALGSVLLGTAPSALPVYAASLILGLASSVGNATGMTYFTWAGGPEARGTSLSLYSAALLTGQALGPSIAGIAASAWGWRAAFLGGAAAAGIVALLALSRSGTVPPHRPSRREQEEPTPMTRGLGRRLVVLQAVPFVMFFTLGSVAHTLVPLIGSDELGLGAGAVGLALGMGGIARFVGTLVGGRVSDRVSRRAALVPALVLEAVGVALLAPWSAVLPWLVAIAVISLSSFAVPVAATVLGDLVPAGRVGSHLGRFRFTGDLGLISGPIAVTAVYEAAGRAPAVLIVAGLLLAVAVLCARWVPETRPA